MSVKRRIYLNSAAAGWPPAPGVAAAVRSALQAMPLPSAYGAPDVVEACRRALARRFEIEDPSRVVLTPDATHALNTAIYGLGLGSGSRVVATVAEHNSVLRPLHHLKRRHPGMELSLVRVRPDGSLDLEQARRILSSGADLVAASHASNVTGCVHDVRRLFSMARASGAVTLLDAAQTVGLLPCSPGRLGADLLAFSGHKFLHGPPGTGGLVVHPRVELEPFCTGGTGVRSDLLVQPPDMPVRLEAGSLDVPAFAGLLQALAWWEREGEGRAGRALELGRRLRRDLSEIPGVRVLGGESGGSYTTVVSFCLEGCSPAEAARGLWERFGIVGRAGLHCAPLIHRALGSAPEGAVRLSTSAFTIPPDVDAAVEAVRILARQR